MPVTPVRAARCPTGATRRRIAALDAPRRRCPRASRWRSKGACCGLRVAACRRTAKTARPRTALTPAPSYQRPRPTLPAPRRARLKLGLDGAALGFVACSATNTALLAAYTAARDCARLGRPDATWAGFSCDALRRWGEYLSLALPALAQIAAEWLAYEVVILMSGARAQRGRALLGTGCL